VSILLLQYSVFQRDCCVYTCFGPTFELENKKREQSSRKRRLAYRGPLEGSSPSRYGVWERWIRQNSPWCAHVIYSDPLPATDDEQIADFVPVKHPRNRRRMEVEECMALDNTLATVYLADHDSTRLFDDPDLLFLRKGNGDARTLCRARSSGRFLVAHSFETMQMTPKVNRMGSCHEVIPVTPWVSCLGLSFSTPLTVTHRSQCPARTRLCGPR